MLLPLTSREYVLIPVSAPASVPDITALDADIAIVPEGQGEPGEADWHAATWLNGEAALLVGPDAQVYAAGEYMAWVRITAAPEQPVMVAGRLRVGDVRF